MGNITRREMLALAGMAGLAGCGILPDPTPTPTPDDGGYGTGGYGDGGYGA